VGKKNKLLGERQGLGGAKTWAINTSSYIGKGQKPGKNTAQSECERGGKNVKKVKPLQGDHTVAVLAKKRLERPPFKRKSTK